MPLDRSLIGRRYQPSAAYEVSREKIREFAEAVGAGDPVHHDPEAARRLGHPDVIAPPTFVFSVVQRALGAVLADPELGVDLGRVIHSEQAFTYHRPVRAGDRLQVTAQVESARTVGGHGILATRSEIASADGSPVAEARTTVLVLPPERPEQEG
jgi:acyl dehydratase